MSSIVNNDRWNVMAFFTINATSQDSSFGFSDIWNHYEKAGFLYDAKLQRMERFMDRTRMSLDKLIAAPETLFQIHAAENEGEIVSSLCGFRDAEHSFVIEHAVSDGRPDLMIQCLLSMTTAASHGGIERVSMFYTPQNRWPKRLARTFSDSYEPDETSHMHFDYGVADWSEAPVFPEAITGDGVPTRTKEILLYWMSALRLEAMGIQDDTDGVMWEFEASAWLRRRQRMVHAFSNGVHVGCMLIWDTPAIMNFSHLCTRAEIYVDPYHPDRYAAVQYLSARAWRTAKQAGREFFVALVPSEAGLCDAAKSFQFPDKQYACFTWPSNGARGFATCAIALSEWYARILTRYMRKPMASAVRVRQ